MLCAKYSYKDDIAVKQKEAFEDGQKDGIIKGKIEGSQQKALEDAKNLLKLKLLSAEQIAQSIGLPLDKVLELQKEISEIKN